MKYMIPGEERREKKKKVENGLEEDAINAATVLACHGTTDSRCFVVKSAPSKTQVQSTKASVMEPVLK